MKRKLTVVLIILCFCVCFISEASDVETIRLENWDEKMNQLFMGNCLTTIQMNNIKNVTAEKFNEMWPDFLSKKKESFNMETDSDEAEYELNKKRWIDSLDYNNGLWVTCLETDNYMDEYVKNKNLNYLFSNKAYWRVSDANYYDKNNQHYTADECRYTFGIEFKIDNAGLDILKNPEQIKNSLLVKGETFIEDIKLFAMPNIVRMSFLYIKTNKSEYLVKLFGESSGDIILPYIELGELYETKDVIDAIEDESTGDYIIKQNLIPKVTKEKNKYETEAQVLQKEGLLKGNEKGLDLLKPLTRAEAVTLLVRALGEEDQTVQYTESAFSDMAADNWAAPYASLAKAKGIAAGVSETEFAPDNRVTSDQFATFVLRAAGEANVDYTQATQLLIDRGIITAEEAETMDLFTRGDMAKIIYEAREKGLL